MSVLSVDANHNNPVLNVFIYFVSLEVQTKARSSFIQELQESSGKHIVYFGLYLSLYLFLNSCIGYYKKNYSYKLLR